MNPWMVIILEALWAKMVNPYAKYIPNLGRKNHFPTKMEGFDTVSLLPINFIFPRNSAILKVQGHCLFLVSWAIALSACIFIFLPYYDDHAIHGLTAQSPLWPMREAREYP